MASKDNTRLRVTLRRGWAGKRGSQVRTLRALGLRRRGDTNTLPDVPSVRGAVEAVSHLIDVEPAAGEGAQS